MPPNGWKYSVQWREILKSCTFVIHIKHKWLMPLNFLTMKGTRGHPFQQSRLLPTTPSRSHCALATSFDTLESRLCNCVSCICWWWPLLPNFCLHTHTHTHFNNGLQNVKPFWTTKWDIYRYVKYVQRLWERIWWHLSFWSFAWFQALLIPIWDDDLMFSEWVAQPAHLGASTERVFPPSGLHTTARRPRSSLGGWPKGTNSLAGRCCPGFPEFIPIYVRVRHRIDWILEATALLKPYDVKVACSKKVNVHKHVQSYKILQTYIKESK